MLEKFTEKAINVVSTAQKCANEMHSANIVSEHLLLALFLEAKGIPLKIFKSKVWILTITSVPVKLRYSACI